MYLDAVEGSQWDHQDTLYVIGLRVRFMGVIDKNRTVEQSVFHTFLRVWQGCRWKEFAPKLLPQENRLKELHPRRWLGI